MNDLGGIEYYLRDRQACAIARDLGRLLCVLSANQGPLSGARPIARLTRALTDDK